VEEYIPGVSEMSEGCPNETGTIASGLDLKFKVREGLKVVVERVFVKLEPSTIKKKN
jgi:hypothetical protein